MPTSTNSARRAKEIEKVRSDLSLNATKLRNLELMTLDSTLSKLLVLLNGEVTISLTSRAANISVAIPLGNKGNVNVSIDEFLSLLNGPAIIAKALKERESKEVIDSLTETVSQILAVDSSSFEQWDAISSQTRGLLKQQVVVLNAARKNLEMVEFVIKKDPQGVFNNVWKYMAEATCETVAKTIVNICRGDTTLSEFQPRIREKLGLPAWVFNKMTMKSIVTQDTNSYSFFFPRDKNRGIRLTSHELVTDSYVLALDKVIERSAFLQMMVRDQKLLNYAIDLDSHLKDEKEREIYEKFAWNLLPPLEESVDKFLELKNKKVVDLVNYQTNQFKQKLEKMNNAVLRVSQMEAGGMNPARNIFKVLFPKSTADYTPMVGKNLYEVVKEEINYEKVVGNFLSIRNEKMLKMWMTHLASELRLAQTDDYFKTMEFNGQKPPNPSGAVKGLLDEISSSMTKEGDKAPTDTTPVVKPKIHSEIGIFSGKTSIKDGNSKFDLKNKIKNDIFHEEKPPAEDKKKVRRMFNSPIFRTNWTGFANLTKKFPEVKDDIERFLRSFTCMPLQREALRRMGAQIDATLDDLDEFESADYGNPYEMSAGDY